MSLTVFEILSWVNSLSTLVIFLFFYTREVLWKDNFKWLGIVLIGSFCSDVIGEILYRNKINPNIALNAWIIFEFLMCSLLYYNFFNKKSIRYFILVLSSVLTIFGLYNFFYLEGPTTLNSYTRSLSCLAMVIYSLYFFFQLLIELPASKLTNYPMFWVSAGVLLYFAGTFILSISIAYLVYTLNSNLIFFWVFILGLNVIKNILFGIGSWRMLKSVPSI